jgi:mono/diheme cytochrome c family protein
MEMRSHLGLIALLAIAGTAPVAAQSSSDTSASTPAKPTTSEGGTAPGASAEGGTPSALVARGDAVFHGPGNCYACHGSKGEGLVGPNLTDSEWIHSKGTLEDIEVQINNGVPKEESKSGIPMPPKGGSTISDEDVKACAAYVHSLSQKSGS